MLANGGEEPTLFLWDCDRYPYPHPFRVPTMRPMEKGDLIICEMHPKFGGYFTHVERTFCLGEPEHEQLDIYEGCLAAYRRGLERFGPGKTISTALMAVKDEIDCARASASAKPASTATAWPRWNIRASATTPSRADREAIKVIGDRFEPGMVFAFNIDLLDPKWRAGQDRLRVRRDHRDHRRPARAACTPSRPTFSASGIERGGLDAETVVQPATWLEMMDTTRQRRLRSRAVLLSVLGLALAGGEARAEVYPQNKITMIVAFAPGGFADTMARLVAQGLSDRLHQNVIVENRAGGGGNIAASLVTRAAPDGYTLLATTTALAINETLFANKQFSAGNLKTAAMVASSPEALATSSDNPARNLPEFIKAKDGKVINFGSAGVGTGSHIQAEYFFKFLAKVPAQHIPFQGGAPAVNAAIAKQIDLLAATLGGGPAAQMQFGEGSRG